MAKLTERLTPLAVTKFTKPGYYPDGGRLYLAVKASGAKSWIFRYRFGGREREMGLENERASSKLSFASTSR